MATPSTGVGRTEQSPPASVVVSTSAAPPPAFDNRAFLQMSTTLELLSTSMKRFESRLEEIDRRTSTTRPPPRPDPDPHSAFPSHWFANPTPLMGPVAIPTHSVVVKSPNQPGPSSTGQAMIPLRATTPQAQPAYLPLRFPSISQELNGYRQQQQPVSTHTQAFPISWDPPNPNFGLGVSQPSTSWDIPVTQQAADLQQHGQPSSWDIPAYRQHSGSHGMDQLRRVKIDPPRFDGTDVANWISRVQYYFDHVMLPEDHRLHYVLMLFDPPVAEWIFNYRASNTVVRWHDFFEDVRRRFDPHCFEDYLGLIAKLCQTGSLADYNTTFEKMRSRVPNHPEASFLSYYVAGLQQPVRNQVKHQHPTSVAAAMALAVDFDSCLEKPPVQQSIQRRNWGSRDQRQSAMSASQPSQPQVTNQQGGRPVYAKGLNYTNLPVIRLTPAQRADRTRRGVCWYCEEKYTPDHTCKSTFLAYMGADEDDVDGIVEPQDVQSADEVITADLSHIYSLEGKQRPAAIELQGSIGARPVSILVDTGSSHDFLHPKVAEKLDLPLQAIKPFRVYVGNGESLICSHASLQTRLVIQSHVFFIDLHILPVHGQDVILGMAWLKTLHRVTSDYDKGTIEFIRNGTPICLQITPPTLRQVSLNSFASIMTLQSGADLFELVQVSPPESAQREADCL